VCRTNEMARQDTIEGFCWLCGRFAKLTREHIPPRAAFNNKSVLLLAVEENTRETGRLEWGGKVEEGLIVRSLCSECNSRGGAKYGTHYVDFISRVAVLLGSTLNRDLRSYNMSRFADIDEEAIKRLLYPLLKAGDRPTGAEMFAVAKPILEGVLDHRREANFLEAMAAGKYQPELLFPKDADIVNRIRPHPALQWKAENVRQYLANQKLS